MDMQKLVMQFNNIMVTIESGIVKNEDPRVQTELVKISAAILAIMEIKNEPTI